MWTEREANEGRDREEVIEGGRVYKRHATVRNDLKRRKKDRPGKHKKSSVFV